MPHKYEPLHSSGRLSILLGEDRKFRCRKFRKAFIFLSLERPEPQPVLPHARERHSFTIVREMASEILSIV